MHHYIVIANGYLRSRHASLKDAKTAASIYTAKHMPKTYPGEPHTRVAIEKVRGMLS